MKRYLLSIAIIASAILPARAEYVDHRGHDVDSLEAVVAPWTADRIASAADAQLSNLNKDWRELMLGYLQTNRERSQHYARKALDMALEKDWKVAIWDAAKALGQHHWAKERYDSAAFYYNIAIDAIERMEVGEVDSGHPDGLTQFDIDNGRSAMYGTIGNLYSMLDSTDLAMDYYARAGKIFEKYGWNSSLACLYSNIGTTWLETGAIDKAYESYTKGLSYAEKAQDSLWIAGCRAGLGTAELRRGHLRKAIRLLDEANQYYIDHEDQEGKALIENLGYTNEVLRLQKRQAKTASISLLAALILLAISICVSRRMRKLSIIKAQTDEVLEETISEIPPANQAADMKLTEREIQVLNGIAHGQTNKEIADKLFLSPETIKWYRKKLLAKFDVSSASALVSEAYKTGILQK